MKKITFVALAALTITACSSGPEFEVNGDISGPTGKCFISKLPVWKVLFRLIRLN